MEGFWEGKICVLVVMDVVGWGIYIDDIFYVVNYSLLEDFEDYVYWIGCIGWVGKNGVSISFVCEEDVF